MASPPGFKTPSTILAPQAGNESCPQGVPTAGGWSGGIGLAHRPEEGVRAAAAEAPAAIDTEPRHRELLRLRHGHSHRGHPPEDAIPAKASQRPKLRSVPTLISNLHLGIGSCCLRRWSVGRTGTGLRWNTLLAGAKPTRTSFQIICAICVICGFHRRFEAHVHSNIITAILSARSSTPPNAPGVRAVRHSPGATPPSSGSILGSRPARRHRHRRS